MFVFFSHLLWVSKSKSNNYLRLGAGVKADVCLYVPETALHIEIVDFKKYICLEMCENI